MRVASLDYDSGGRHGHADALNLGLFAKGLICCPTSAIRRSSTAVGEPRVLFGKYRCISFPVPVGRNAIPSWTVWQTVLRGNL